MDEPGRRRREPEAAGADLVVPLMALAFAAYFFWSIRGLVWEAKANGVVVGSVLVVLVLIQLARTAREVLQGRATLELGPLIRPWPVQLRRLAVVVLMALFVATLEWVGTLLGLFLLTAGCMFLLGVRDWRWLTGLPFAICAFVYVMFFLFLHARLPRGPVEAALAWIAGG